MVILERRSWSPIVAMSQLSMTMEPVAGSMIRNRASVREDLPAPVRPTMPTYTRIKERHMTQHNTRGVDLVLWHHKWHQQQRNGADWAAVQLLYKTTSRSSLIDTPGFG